jgi:hypothetical protein
MSKAAPFRFLDNIAAFTDLADECHVKFHPYLFRIGARPSDFSPRAMIQHHCRTAAAPLHHRSGAELCHPIAIYHMSSLRAAFILYCRTGPR